MRTYFVVPFLLLPAACSSSGADPCAASNAIHVPAILSLTGGLAAYGPAIDSAVSLAAKEINAQGGVLSRPFCIDHKDDGTDPAKATTVAQAAITEQNLGGIIGGISSGSSVAILGITKPRNTLQISCCSTSPALSAKDNFFRTVPSDALQAKVLARAAVMKGYKTVSIIHVSGPYGDGLRENFTTNFTADGMHQIVTSTVYTSGKSDYMSTIQPILTSSITPDAILLIAYPMEAQIIINEILTARHNSPVNWLFTDGLPSEAFLNTLGSASVAGAIGTAPTDSPDPTDMSHKAQFLTALNRFTLESNTSEPLYTSNSYDAVYLMAGAIEAAGKVDPSLAVSRIGQVTSATGMPFGPGQWKEIRTALDAGASVLYQGASGSLALDDNGDPLVAFYQVWTVTPGNHLSPVRVEKP